MQRSVIAITSAVAITAMLGVTWYATSGGDDPFADCRASAIAGGSAAIGGPFTLINGQGQTVSDTDVITEPSLIYFGYTFCPDVCPLDNARNAETVSLLEERGTSVTPVFITIDPERDTPEVMGEFVEYLHPKMIGLSGSEEQLSAARKAYRAYAKKQPSDDDDLYLVDHSTFTYLVMPEIGFVEFFRRDSSAEDLAEKVQCFVNAT